MHDSAQRAQAVARGFLVRARRLLNPVSGLESTERQIRDVAQRRAAQEEAVRDRLEQLRIGREVAQEEAGANPTLPAITYENPPAGAFEEIPRDDISESAAAVVSVWACTVCGYNRNALNETRCDLCNDPRPAA